MTSKTNLKLTAAHPVSHDGVDYAVGDRVEVTPQQARGLVDAGIAGPADAASAKALGIAMPDKPEEA